MMRSSLWKVAMFAGAAVLCSAPLASQSQVAELDALTRELPVIESPAHLLSPTIVVFISGDGGWAKIEKDMTSELNDHGVSVAGFDLREYLRRKPRTTEDIGRDVGRIVRAYSDAWSRPNVVLLGFSRGAGVAPFVLTRLPSDLQSRLVLTAFVGLPRAVNLTFHWIDVVRNVKRADDIPVLPELARVGGSKMLCIFGAEEAESGCRAVPASVRRIELPGGHHLEHAYRALSDSILRLVPR